MTRISSCPIEVLPPRSTAFRSPRRARKRRAMVLIIVLVVVAALCLGALAFSSLMVGEREVTHMTGRGIQAMALAESGIEAARQFLMEHPDVEYAEGAWYHDLDQFQGVLVIDDEIAQDRGRFSIVAPGETQGSNDVRFGFVCESSKLNLNTLLTGSDTDATAARERLMVLPGMTEEIADCILDWLDEDDEPREFGVEAEYYESLATPYRPTNGPIRCLEELLAVRGVTSGHLLGADRNRNGVLDADESDSSMVSEADVANGSLQGGWSAYLTLHSRESIRREDGEPKINLNQDDAQTLHDELEAAFGTDWARFIVGYRQQEQANSQSSAGTSETNQDSQDKQNDTNASETSSTSATAGATAAGSDSVAIEYADRVPEQLDLTKPLNRKLDSVLDLIGSSIQVKYDDGKKIVTVSPLFANEPEAMRDYLPKLLDQVTTETEETVAGRINVNLAPVEVLASVPGIDATLAENIVGHRPAEPSSVEAYQRHSTWLLVDGLVSLDQMKKLLPYLTAGGSVFQVGTVGFFDEGGPVVRLQAVLDATESPPRMLSLKDLTPLGRGFDPASLGAKP
ncbi:MAG: general secretion pathway protein GspK [Pirellulales bacterium]|nr:general secretion pathway protein GspK [Pirellulales bacterium]